MCACRSVSIIEYTPKKLDTSSDEASGAATTAPPVVLGDNTLNEVGRHMQALWSTAVIHIEDDSYLVADHNGNLVVCSPLRLGLLTKLYFFKQKI